MRLPVVPQNLGRAYCAGGPEVITDAEMIKHLAVAAGRRDPETLRVGDHVDSWHVIGLEPGRRLTLMMDMKAPGCGVLERAGRPGLCRAD